MRELSIVIYSAEPHGTAQLKASDWPFRFNPILRGRGSVALEALRALTLRAEGRCE